MVEHCQILYRSRDGTSSTLSLAEADSLCFEELVPYRLPKSYRTQRHMPGLYWFSSTSRHVFYESRLELKALISLDFDSTADEVIAQPFAISYEEKAKRKVHIPDFLALCSSKSPRVVDVKPGRRAAEPEIKRVLDATREACLEAGWEYEVFTGDEEPVMLENVGWLAGFRRTPVMFEDISRRVLFSMRQEESLEIGKIAQVFSPSALCRPIVYHLLWRQILITDLSKILSNESLAYVSKGAKDL